VIFATQVIPRLFSPRRSASAATGLWRGGHVRYVLPKRMEVAMPANKLKEFLDSQQIKYVTIAHSVAYTAQGIAALTHTSGKELAKTVIVKIDDGLAMAVLPASCHVDVARLQAATRAKTVILAKEREFKDRFPECETGAMPPFGNLYQMPVFVD